MQHICQVVTDRQCGVEELVKGAIPYTYTYVIGGYYNKHLITDQHFWVDNEACIQCGLCAKLCPVDDIEGTPNTTVPAQTVLPVITTVLSMPSIGVR